MIQATCLRGQFLHSVTFAWKTIASKTPPTGYGCLRTRPRLIATTQQTSERSKRCSRRVLTRRNEQSGHPHLDRVTLRRTKNGSIRQVPLNRDSLKKPRFWVE